jgi:hypothetical protein
VIIASDTRLTNGGYGIMSRNQSKLFQLSDKIVLGATGCWADVLTLTKMIEARIQVSFNYITFLNLNLGFILPPSKAWLIDRLIDWKISIRNRNR